jgi:hypothetical protein
MKSKIKCTFEMLITAKLIHIILAFFLLLTITALYLLPGYWYSPDSFSYYELSKTFFGNNDFYRPNTIRSYLSLEHSAAFPFLYPALIATLNQVFGDSYLNAAYYNVAFMLFSYFLLLKITIRYTENPLVSSLFSLSILIFPGYIEEVLSGRSIPLSLFLILSSLLLYSRGRINLSMYLLGLCCLVRFDILPLAIFISIFTSFIRKNISPTLFFVLGLLPWVIYSILYFNKIWITDNSWVATSSLRAYVTDFPASSDYTIFNDTFTWFNRVLKNYILGNYYYLRALVTNFLIIVFLFFFFKRKEFLKVNLKNYVFIFLAISASLAPYYLSGYFDRRYFYLPIMIIGLFVLSECKLDLKKTHAFLIIPMICFLPAEQILIPIVRVDIIKERIEQRNGDLKLLEKLHDKEKNVTYFIKRRNGGLNVSPMYGALTGNKVAFPPQNINDIDQVELNNYIGENKTIILDDYQ